MSEEDGNTTLGNVPGEVYARILGWCDVEDLLIGVWSLNKRTNELLRSLISIWRNAYCRQWDVQLEDLDPHQDWRNLSRIRMREELLRLDPVTPFAMTVNKFVMQMFDHVKMTPQDQERLEITRPSLPLALTDAKRMLRWNYRLEESWPSFLENLSAQYPFAVGAELLKSRFIDAKSHYPICAKSYKSKIISVDAYRFYQRTELYSQFLVYNSRGKACKFQYFHRHHDPEGDEMTTSPRLGLWYDGQGIFFSGTDENWFDKETYLRAKRDVLGLQDDDMSIQSDSELAILSDSLLLSYLCQVGLYAQNWRSSHNMIFSESFTQPLNNVIRMCSHFGGFDDDDEKEAYEASFGTRGTTWTGPAATEPAYADLVRLTNKTDKSFEVVPSPLDQADEEHPGPAGDNPFPYAQIHPGSLNSLFSNLITIRAQIGLDAHLNRWLDIMEDSAAYGFCNVDTTGLELIRELLAQSDVIVPYFSAQSRIVRGATHKHSFCNFTIRPKSKQPNALPNPGETRETADFSLTARAVDIRDSCSLEVSDVLELRFVVDSERQLSLFSAPSPAQKVKYVIEREADASPLTNPTTEDKQQAYTILELKRRLFGDPHVDISADMLLGFLFTVFRASAQWRADDRNGYTELTDNGASKLHTATVFMFNDAMLAARDLFNLARTMNYEADAEFDIVHLPKELEANGDDDNMQL